MDIRDSLRGSHANFEASSECESPSLPSLQGQRSGIRRSSEIIVGWRAWGVSSLDPTSARPAAAKTLILVSTFMDSQWPPGEVMKACCGANMLRHGVHAFSTSAEAMKYMA